MRRSNKPCAMRRSCDALQKPNRSLTLMTILSSSPFAASAIPISRLLLATAVVTVMAGCGTVDSALQGDKLDYRSKAGKTASLEVPPDLTQITRDARYAPQTTGVVSASAFQTGTASTAAATAAAASTIAPTAIGEFKVVRSGNQRWLQVPAAADAVWPVLRTFWEERGFSVVSDNAQAGVLETSWAENRAKLSDDVIRRSLGRVFDALYSTGERDKFRMRLERGSTPNTSEIYISHFGMEEVLTGALKESSVWVARPNDPQLEAEFLQRLMVKLGSKTEDSKAVIAAASNPGSAASERARIVTGQPAATLQVDDNFDRAWRRVGLALDRNGFTVEDRDRTAGLYFVRYADPRNSDKEEPGFFSRLLGGGTSNAPARYRVNVKGENSDRSTVTVLNSQGAPEGGDVGQRIATLLLAELR
jgi:outer membrane protein assembly factor BamC